MDIEVKGVLVNLLIIILGQLMILLIHNIKLKGLHAKYQSKLSIFIASSISIILCMTFSFEMGEGLIYDLRYIPLLLGALYGGLNVGIGLLLVLNIYRFFIGGFGFFLTLASSVIITLIAARISKEFLHYKTHKKVLIGICLLHLTPLCTFMILTVLDMPYLPLSQWIINGIIFTIGIVLLIYFTEEINKHILLKEQMVHFEKSVTVSHLAASIAHEVRNPLTTVKGFLQLLFIKEEDDKRKNYYKTIFSELEKAENIIHDYLTYAKPKSQENELIDIKAEVEKTTSILKPIANKNLVRIKTELEPHMTNGIIQHFQQSLINLIKNGIEAMPNGGELHISLKGNDGKALLSICDTGHGLSKDQIMKLGQPYFSTKGDQGTGLGLLVTYNILKSMGGSIEVDSTVNQGTCFHIHLPLEKKNQKTLEEVASDKD